MYETDKEENKCYLDKNKMMTEKVSAKDSTNVAQEKSPESPTEDSTATSCDPPSPGTAALQKESPKSVESTNSAKTNENPTADNEELELEGFSKVEKDYEELENKKCSVLKKLEEVDPEDLEDGEIADEEDEAEEQSKKTEKEKKKEKKKRRHSEEDKEKSSGKKKRSREDEVEEDFVFVGGASPPKVFETDINSDINNFRFPEGEEFGDDSRRRRRSPPHWPSGGGSGRGGRRREEPQVGPPPSRRSCRPAKEKKKNDVVCTYFMQGKCQKSSDDCPYSHDAFRPRRMELCKFWMMGRCAKKEICLYSHSDFPCKYYHTGLVCKMADRCKFSHEPLSVVTKSVLLRHIETAPKEILGDFPRLDRTGALNLINKMESKINGTLEHERMKAEREREDHSGRRTRRVQPTRDDHEKLHELMEEAEISGYYKDTLEYGPDDYQPQHSNNNKNHGPHGGPPHHGGGHHGVTHGGPHGGPRNQMSPQRPPMNQMNFPMNQQGPPPINQQGPPPMNHMNQNQAPLNQMNPQGPKNPMNPNALPGQLFPNQMPGKLGLSGQILPGQLPQLNLPALMGSYPPGMIKELVNNPVIANVLVTLSIPSTTILKTEEDRKEPPEHLPKMQRELFLRIQRQQMKNEQKEKDISDDEKGTGWYSSDEESDRKKESPDLSSVLSAIRQSVQPAPEEPKPETSPPRGDVALRYNNSNLFGDTDYRLPPLRPEEFNDVDLRGSPNNKQSVIKSAPASSAIEIKAVYDNHAPLTYKLTLIQGLGKPDYSHIRLTVAPSMIVMDPRLGPRKDASGQLPAPASPSASLRNVNLPVPNIPADILVDPRSSSEIKFGDPRSAQQPAALWPPGPQDINSMLAFGTFPTDFSNLRPQQAQQRQQQRFPSASSWERYNQQQSSGNLTPPI